MARTRAAKKKRIQIVRVRQLKPFWGNRLNDRPGYGRWAVTPVGGPEGYLHMNRNDGAVITESCTVGYMYFPVAVSSPGIHVHEGFDEVYVVHKGELALRFEDGNEEVLGPLDCGFIPAGVPHGARNGGTSDCQLIYFQTGVEREGFQTGKATNLGRSRWLSES